MFLSVWLLLGVVTALLNHKNVREMAKYEGLSPLDAVITSLVLSLLGPFLTLCVFYLAINKKWKWK